MQSIYLMPFTPKSVLLCHALHERGINVAGFLDNDCSIHGKRYLNTEVYTPEKLKKERADAIVVLCESRHYKANSEQLLNMGIQQCEKIEDWMSIEESRSVMRKIDKEAFDEIVPRQSNTLLRLPYNIHRALLPELVESTDAIFLDILDLIVTEKCSLKCRQCANLTQYYAKPQHMSMEQVRNDADLLFSFIDWISDFYIFGGEVFLFNNFVETLDYVAQYKRKYGQIAVITNGTIIPTERMLQSMNMHAMFVTISDYGVYSRQLGALISKLETYQIPYSLARPKWYDYTQLVDGEKRDPEMTFSKCKHNCTTLRNGYLYRCPFLANAEALSAFPYSEYNHINIRNGDLTKADISELLAKPINYTRKIPPGCAYCSGYDVGNMQCIPIAEQTSNPLPYKIYG